MEKITKETVQRMTQQLHQKHLERMKIKSFCNNNSEILNDFMLRYRQYDISVLEKNINNLSLNTLLYTQKLTSDFCAKYILSENYASCVEETYICIGDVLSAQKHITKKELLEALDKLEKN
jgi:hypothetical protein